MKDHPMFAMRDHPEPIIDVTRPAVQMTPGNPLVGPKPVARWCSCVECIGYESEAGGPMAGAIDWAEVVLIDEYPDLWRLLKDHRGGCSCHIAPPCNTCCDPVTEKEISLLAEWHAESKVLP